MEFKQVIFKEIFDSEGAIPSSGIACYKNNNLEFIICACCGGIFEPGESEIIKEYENWADFADIIKGVG